MPATVSGEVAGVSYTLYENGMLKSWQHWQPQDAEAEERQRC